MTFLELYGEALDRELGTTDRTIAFKTATRKSVVNEGVREFNRLTNCFTKQTTVLLTDAVSEYDLRSLIALGDDDYLRLAKQGVEVHKVDAASQHTYWAGDDLPRHDIPWLNRFQPGWRTASKGTPQSYYLREDGGHEYWGLYPAPSVGAGETWTGIIPYVALPPLLVADPDVPFTANGVPKTTLTDWHKAAVHFAAGQLEKYVRKNQQAYADQLQLFGGYVADYVAQQHPKGGQRVTMAKTYYRPRGGITRVQDPRRFP
jgi:hypothetical protein